ncbi:alpha-ketoglutarate-dependent sulfonate dioxygenase [Hyphodiscus hymeniophilus]|uniref:Alpha-ketoglutarate-dependent sulfonate dioxygenase n=1 Tax=Hyphodiscus hymeniophilus TaxID=353542 RepID=A0A9P6VKJ1_9HELO|nr:alpha-ketoglutarate-dependent sulfonate dioxygenase [Hyphodiscus hymeniophilus]
MAPSVDSLPAITSDSNGHQSLKTNGKVAHKERLSASGALPSNYFDVTSVIGREYPDLQISELMNSPRRDEYIRDLAITVSERGVVFFRKQKDLTVSMQKELIDLIGKLSGKPSSSGLHVHPLIEGKRDVGINDKGDTDQHISVISSQLSRKLHLASRYTFSSKGWHSDMTFEHVPSDYAVLKMRVVPPTGGDTLWASGYEMYDRLSKPYQRFLEGLTAKHANPDFIEASQRVGFQIHPGPRGATENVGQDLIADHPVIRTNPVTGWKSVYGALNQIQQLNELTKQESDEVLRYLGQLVTNNHDLQVRFKWGVDDVAIWDNRSTFHTGTGDVDVTHTRTGNRAVSMGEVPYLDPASISRREAMGESE